MFSEDLPAQTDRSIQEEAAVSWSYPGGRSILELVLGTLCPRAQLRMGSRLSTSMLAANERMVKRFSRVDYRLDSLGSTLWRGEGAGTDCLPEIPLSLSVAALWISWLGTDPGQCPLLSLWSSSAICVCCSLMRTHCLS